MNEIFENNKKWVERELAKDPDYLRILQRDRLLDVYGLAAPIAGLQPIG